MKKKSQEPKDIEPIKSHKEFDDKDIYSYSSPKKSKTKKFLEELGTGGLVFGSGIFVRWYNLNKNDFNMP